MPQTAAINTRIAQSSNAPVTGNSSKNYASATAGDQTKLGAGIFYGIQVNTVGSGSTVTAYDGTSTSGKKLGTWSTAALPTNNFIAVGGVNGLAFATGLFVVVTTTAPDVTIVYR